MGTRRAPAAVLGVLLTAGLLAGCDGEPPEAVPSGPAASRDPSPAPSTRPEAAPGVAADALPDRPATGDPKALARELTVAHRAVRTAETPRAVVRRAAELEQLAARDLALGPPGRVAEVLRHLKRPTRERTRAHVEAARRLGALTAPQPELPDWRIVSPPGPARLLGHYRAAERALDVPWEYLAAIHLVETRMGRIRGVSTAGAQGPMQFLPTTWDLYGAGGDIHDPADAVMAAARLLRANGAPGDMPGALWHYNPSDDYVEAVGLYAGQLRRDPATYRGYWYWRVLYKHVDDTLVLEPGYPRQPAVDLP